MNKKTATCVGAALLTGVVLGYRFRNAIALYVVRRLRKR